MATKGAVARSVVQIVASSKKITDKDKKGVPVPEVLYGEYIRVEVGWARPLADGLSLTLSQFRVLSYEKRGARGWSWKTFKPLSITDENGENITRQGVVFNAQEMIPPKRNSWPKEVIGVTTRVFKLPAPKVVDDPELIMFKQTIRLDKRVLFEHDPPWAGKKGKG